MLGGSCYSLYELCYGDTLVIIAVLYNFFSVHSFCTTDKIRYEIGMKMPSLSHVLDHYLSLSFSKLLNFNIPTMSYELRSHLALSPSPARFNGSRLKYVKHVYQSVHASEILRFSSKFAILCSILDIITHECFFLGRSYKFLSDFKHIVHFFCV